MCPILISCASISGGTCACAIPAPRNAVTRTMNCGSHKYFFIFCTFLPSRAGPLWAPGRFRTTKSNRLRPECSAWSSGSRIVRFSSSRHNALPQDQQSVNQLMLPATNQLSCSSSAASRITIHDMTDCEVKNHWLMVEVLVLRLDYVEPSELY